MAGTWAARTACAAGARVTVLDVDADKLRKLMEHLPNVETSRPTTIADPAFTYHGVTHYCIPNLAADMGRSTSVAVAQAILPYILRIGDLGIDKAIERVPDIARGAYNHQAKWIGRGTAEASRA